MALVFFWLAVLLSKIAWADTRCGSGKVFDIVCKPCPKGQYCSSSDPSGRSSACNAVRVRSPPPPVSVLHSPHPHATLPTRAPTTMRLVLLISFLASFALQCVVCGHQWGGYKSPPLLTLSPSSQLHCKQGAASLFPGAEECPLCPPKTYSPVAGSSQCATCLRGASSLLCPPLPPTFCSVPFTTTLSLIPYYTPLATKEGSTSCCYQDDLLNTWLNTCNPFIGQAEKAIYAFLGTAPTLFFFYYVVGICTSHNSYTCPLPPPPSSSLTRFPPLTPHLIPGPFISYLASLLRQEMV